MIDNFEKILTILDFSDPGLFYWVQIIQRRKENPSLDTNSHHIKSYYISSMSDLSDIKGEITALCMVFNARAMINVRRRSFKSICHAVNIRTANMLASGEHKSIVKQTDKLCGAYPHSKDKVWVIDIDFDDYKWMTEECLIHEVKSQIDRCSGGVNVILAEIPTPNGMHLITSPFDSCLFSEESIFTMDMIKRNDMTNIFVPNILPHDMTKVSGENAPIQLYKLEQA